MVSLRKEIILSFLRLHPRTAFWTLVDYDGYSISSKVFLPGESHGQRSLVGYSPRAAKSQIQLSDFTFTFILGRSDAEAETPILWTPDAEN